MHWGDWDAMRDWWWVMAIGMTLFWAFVIWAVMRIVRDRNGASTPEEIARRRFAAGEINEEEFRRLTTTLGS